MPSKPMRPLRTGPKRTTADAIRDAELRSGRAGRVVSLSEFQNLTGYDRGTVSRWIERGCPVEGKGAKGATLVDIRAVMDWREEEARADERRKVPEATVDHGSSDPDAELKREQIKFQKIKTAQITGVLVPTSVVELTYATCLNIVRQTVMGLPGRIERDLLGFPVSVVRKAKTDMTIQCRAALKEARGSMDEAIRKATKQRLAEIGAEEDEEFDDTDVFADLVEEEDGDGEA